MYFGDYVKAGQNFYYSVNVEYKPDGSLPNDPWFSSRDYNLIASQVASAASSFADVRVVGAGDTNITLSVTSRMDRASEQDIKGNLDAIVASQPEVAALHGSMIRLTDAGSASSSGSTQQPGQTGGTGGGSVALPGLPGGQPFQLGSISPTMWAVIGIGLWLVLKR